MNEQILPIAERLDAEDPFAGRGVPIAFLDSGFYPHPDLVSPEDRVLAYHAVEGSGPGFREETDPPPWLWHGTQTSVVAAGNGALSDGRFRGLAFEAPLVLVQVGESGRIKEEHIRRGLEWVLANRERYGIRIVNISCGGDRDAPLPENALNQLAEMAVASGLVLVVAAGNSGHTLDACNCLPPATAPSVITVGGSHDASLGRGEIELDWSSFGHTADGMQKPEIVAPAMGVAAPILPGTELFRRAEVWTDLETAPDDVLADLPEEVAELAGVPPELRSGSADAVRSFVHGRLVEGKVVARHYQHVDGTSFAAPIASSIVARMLEANPALTPGQVKTILLATAKPIEGAPPERQGFGVLDARRAVEAASAAAQGLGVPETAAIPVGGRHES